MGGVEHISRSSAPAVSTATTSFQHLSKDAAHLTTTAPQTLFLRADCYARFINCQCREYCAGQTPTMASALAHCSSVTSEELAQNSVSNPGSTASRTSCTNSARILGQRMRITISAPRSSRPHFTFLANRPAIRAACAAPPAASRDNQSCVKRSDSRFNSHSRASEAALSQVDAWSRRAGMGAEASMVAIRRYIRKLSACSGRRRQSERPRASRRFAVGALPLLRRSLAPPVSCLTGHHAAR